MRPYRLSARLRPALHCKNKMSMIWLETLSTKDLVRGNA